MLQRHADSCRTASLLLVHLIAFGAPPATAGMADDPQQDVPQEYVAWPEQPATTTHALTIDGRTLHYEAVAGTMTLVDAKREPTARIFYVSYRQLARDPAEQARLDAAHREAVDRGETPPPPPSRFPDPASRPITFAFNGGPGSSSVWLHLGAFGPRRVDFADEMGSPGPPP